MALTVAIAWAVGRPGQDAVGEGEILVAAAASLADAMTVLGKQYERDRGDGVGVRFDFASSGGLRNQIEGGAPADVFVSASTRHVDALADAGYVAGGTRRDLLTNTLVCVVRASSDLRLAGPEDLAGAAVERVSIGNPAHVPAGRYAAQALRKLGLWDRLAGRLVYCADVRAALVQVSKGAVDAAIVYLSDARSAPDVRVAHRFPAECHSKIVYLACVLAGSSRPDQANAFVRFLASPEAREVFADHGFTPVEADANVARSSPAISPRQTPMWTEASTEALRLSILVSTVTTIVLVIVGTPVAFWLARHRRVGPRLVESALSLPLVVPPVVTGYCLLLLLSPAGPLGKLLATMGVRIAFDWKGAVLAAFAMALPIFLVVAKTAFQRCDPALEAAARTLNAGRLRVFATVTLPLAAPGLLAAAAVSFARAFGEFGATIMLAGNIPGRTQTVSQGVYTDLMAGRDSAAWGLVLVSVAVGIVAMVASQLLIARSRPAAAGEGGLNA